MERKPENKQAGVEVEVTPEMMEAGCQVLLESGALANDYLSSADPLLVCDIFQAMWGSRPHKTRREGG